MKETIPDGVIYILSVPRAASQDSGTYECSITHVMSGAVRAGGVAVTVFGESSDTEIHFFSFIPSKVFKSAGQTSSSCILNDVFVTAVSRVNAAWKCVETILGC